MKEYNWFSLQNPLHITQLILNLIYTLSNIIQVQQIYGQIVIVRPSSIYQLI